MSRRFVVYKVIGLLFCLIMMVGVLEKTAAIRPLKAATTEETSPSGEPAVVLVQFKADLLPHERDQVIAQMGGELLAWLPALNTAQIRLRPEPAVQAAHLQTLASDEAIIFAETDGLVQAAMTPNDPDITDQRKVYAPELLDLFAGWEYTTGDKNIVIAVLDSGIATGHPEFTDRLLPGYDFVQQDHDPADENGHGTHVAGIVGARFNNAMGVAGVCAECMLLPVRVLNAQNIGSWMNVAQGVIYAVDNGARVIVMSLGSTIYSQTMKNAVDYAQARGVLLVAAAGNSNSAELFYPAAFSEVLGVGATNQQDQRWAFSNYGKNADVMAPGDAIYSTYLGKNEAAYQSLTGTSMAAPFVAGLAGLLLAQSPTRTITDVTQIITATIVDLGDPGPDSRYGAGRIDIHAAVRAGAPTQLPAGTLTGAVWKDQNTDGQFDPTAEPGLAGVLVQVQNEQGGRTALAVTNATGAWRVSGLPTGVYTLHITSTLAADLIPAPDRRVLLTEPVTLRDLNFGFIPTSTSNAITGFAVVRTGQSVTLTWTVIHPLVETIYVQRALSANGPFTTVYTRTITPQEIATRQSITLLDDLPAELSGANLYYQLQVSPHNLVYGPKQAGPAHVNGERWLFLPLIRNSLTR